MKSWEKIIIIIEILNSTTVNSSLESFKIILTSMCTTICTEESDIADKLITHKKLTTQFRLKFSKLNCHHLHKFSGFNHLSIYYCGA